MARNEEDTVSQTPLLDELVRQTRANAKGSTNRDLIVESLVRIQFMQAEINDMRRVVDGMDKALAITAVKVSLIVSTAIALFLKIGGI